MMHHRRDTLKVVGACLALAFAGCGDDAGTLTDSDTAPGDSGLEDARLEDGRTDSATDDDAGFDAGDDTGSDSDAGDSASGSDAGPGDMGPDSETPDAGPDAMDVDASDAGDGSASFFVTSTGTGDAGGNLGGLSGADTRCADLALAAGLPERDWRAYLSLSAGIDGDDAVHARDRIGMGPWFNVRGELIAADIDGLHTDGIDITRIVDESGASVPMMQHDILTGSDPDGRAFDAFPGNPAAPGPTCGNWTCNTDDCFAWVGHSDADPGDSWSSTHGSMCSRAGLAATWGSGRTYCFAAD